MALHVSWWECSTCGKQYDACSLAEACEWDHEIEKEQSDASA